jgi:hypothetical protein
MAWSAHAYAAELAPAESTDPIVQAVARNVRSIIKDLGIDQQVPGLQIHFPDFADVNLAPEKPIYYTEGCLSVLPSTVVVNARFLLDTEAAIRSFGLCEVLLNTPYLRNDACMFGLVKRIREDGKDWLGKLREFEDGQKSAERYAVDELTITALFFCAHEIGHLKDGVNAGQYAAFIDPGKPLETRLANAAIKLRRHASEFEAYGFDLPGWKGVVMPEHEVFAAAEKVRGSIAREDEDNAEWFKKEISADDAAVQLMVRYLKDQPIKYRWLLVRGLFAAALYAWYKDLLEFCERMDVPRMGTKPMLSFELMKNPKAYIRAASLFGDVHRCTILRSTLAIQEILNASAGEKDGGAAGAEDKDTLLGRAASLWSRLFGAGKVGDDERERHWKSQSAQCHLLLAIHMDTVVKLAYVGASMPWMIKKEDERGSPQLMMIQFESIDQSVARLKKMMDMN